MEMGTGKTLVATLMILHRINTGQIKRAIILCPSSIRYNWKKEWEKFGDPKIPLYVQGPGKARKAIIDFFAFTTGVGPGVLVLGIEGLSAGVVKESIGTLPVEAFPTMIVMDESSRIKNFKAKRTKNAIKLAQRCTFRLIMTGTPITQGYMDIYSQMEFLSKRILGHNSFYSFRARHALMGGFKNKEIKGYVDEDIILNTIKPFTYTITKKEALDLPEKIYVTRQIEMGEDQRKAYKAVKKGILVEKMPEVKTALEGILRLQQIAGGFIAEEKKNHLTGDIETHTVPLQSNPKIEELKNIIEETAGQVIIWARYRHEVAAIAKAVGADTLVGGMADDERAKVVDRFQLGLSKIIVGTQASGGIGITLTAANTVIYYSNTFSLEDRLQSEDRAHRISQTDSVLYIDLVAAPVDHLVFAALKRKQNLETYLKKYLTEYQGEL